MYEVIWIWFVMSCVIGLISLLRGFAEADMYPMWQRCLIALFLCFAMGLMWPLGILNNAFDSMFNRRS